MKEEKKVGEVAKTDEAILNTINFCLKNEITKINALFIFISFETGVTKDDTETFKLFLEKFAHQDINVAMVITRCENKDENWKKEILEQLNQQKYFSEVLKKPNIHVLFMGAIDGIKNHTIAFVIFFPNFINFPKLNFSKKNFSTEQWIRQQEN